MDNAQSTYTVASNGVITIARDFPDILAPWSKEKVPDYLGLVNHDLKIKGRSNYERQLKQQETEFNLLVRQLKDAGKSAIILLQGRDGAGKTGATMRIAEALADFKILMIVPIGPPKDEELSYPYLWRFFKYDRMPQVGQVRVLDRSWMERLLVERAMKLTPKAEIRNSYAELRAFEWLLNQSGMLIVKCWLDITYDEQGKRFARRHEDRPWKVSTSDDVARQNWDYYTGAANEMFHRTGTLFSPWHIISSEDKRYSRVMVLSTVNQELRRRLSK